MPTTRPLPLRILVVDDHADTAGAIAELFRRSGDDVATAGGVAEALVAAGAMPRLDLLVSDIALPDGDGCDLLRRLRSGGGPRFAIAVTGNVDERLREECGRAGYGLFLPKPMVFGELLAAVEALRQANGHDGRPHAD
jgi:CheY-like chemotaxis protein